MSFSKHRVAPPIKTSSIRTGHSPFRAFTKHEPGSTECLARTTTEAKDQVESRFLSDRSRQSCSRSATGTRTRLQLPSGCCSPRACGHPTGEKGRIRKAFTIFPSEDPNASYCLLLHCGLCSRAPGITSRARQRHRTATCSVLLDTANAHSRYLQTTRFFEQIGNEIP